MQPSQLKNITNKIIDYTKQVCLKQPADTSIFSVKILTGKNKWQLLGSFGLEWWITQHGRHCCEDIADMAIKFDSQLQGGDREYFYEIIETTFRENADNLDIFNVDSVFLRLVDNLFEARAIKNANEFALVLWREIRSNLEKSIANWIILYPLRQIKSSSYSLSFDGLSLLASNDRDVWEQRSAYYGEAKYWNPVFGIWKNEQNQSTFKEFIGVQTWLVCETSGTKLASKKQAGQRMRTFLALLFSYLDNQEHTLLLKSGADTACYAIQFPDDPTKVGSRCVNSPIGILAPPLLVNGFLNISSEILAEVCDWYLQRDSAPDNPKNRAITASQFIHYAIIHNDLERFLHFFIALDALFGERYKVEKNIVESVRYIFPGDPKWENRIEKLYELRNELVHGGASSISDWSEFYNYRRQFKSYPLQDIKTFAMRALTLYFKHRLYRHFFT